MIIQRLLLTAWIEISFIRFARAIVQISTIYGPICHSLGLPIQREFCWDMKFLLSPGIGREYVGLNGNTSTLCPGGWNQLDSQLKRTAACESAIGLVMP